MKKSLLIGGLLLIALFSWRAHGARRHRDVMIAHAQGTLKTLADLEDAYLVRFGGYTDSVDKLADMTDNAAVYKTALGQSLDTSKGLDIALAPDKRSFTIVSYARDPGRTRVALNGPRPGDKGAAVLLGR